MKKIIGSIFSFLILYNVLTINTVEASCGHPPAPRVITTCMTSSGKKTDIRYSAICNGYSRIMYVNPNFKNATCALQNTGEHSCYLSDNSLSPFIPGSSNVLNYQPPTNVDSGGPDLLPYNVQYSLTSLEYKINGIPFYIKPITRLKVQTKDPAYSIELMNCSSVSY